MNLTATLTALLLCLCGISPESFRRVCYHTNWSHYRPGAGKFYPENIDPSLCSHIIFAFAKLNGNHLHPFEWNDESTDWQKGMYERFNDLKQFAPSLKTLLAVGGWNMGSGPFTAMVSSPSNRNEFAIFAAGFLRDRNFDGLDLDWEYPASRGSPPEDKDKFSLLVKETRAVFDEEAHVTGKPRLLLTAAVAAGKRTVDDAYDVPEISKHLDFINLMTYDFHGGWDPIAGHNSPLYPRSDETGYDRYLNMDSASRYWIQLGCPKEKLVIGMAMYGRSFRLESENNTGIGAPIKGKGTPGNYTREKGFLAYYEVCQMQRNGGQVYRAPEQKVPYIVKGDQWVGYDDPESLEGKMNYTLTNGYGGVMVWALDLDDFSGLCGDGQYPLLRTLSRLASTGAPTILSTPAITPHKTTTLSTTTIQAGTTVGIGPSSTSSVPSTTMMAASETSTNTTTDGRGSKSTPNSPSCQPGQDYIPSTTSCRIFYRCSNGVLHKFVCNSKLVFNQKKQHCDWPSNYKCTIGQGAGPTVAVVPTPITTTPTITKITSVEPVSTAEPTTSTEANTNRDFSSKYTPAAHPV
ncbi:hypothetical protein ScPMuIL_004054 [Solemya velum]